MGLFQRGADRRKIGFELGADPLHYGNDRKRDAGSDQSILNRGCAQPGNFFCSRVRVEAAG
jgi:hypothetical protein